MKKYICKLVQKITFGKVCLGWCGINCELIEEISRFFSLEPNDSKGVIGRWVEDTLQMRVNGDPWPTNRSLQL